MIKKYLLFSLIFIISCGYQPVYVNKVIKEIEFYKIHLEGDKEVNRRIINFLSIKENKLDNMLEELFLDSTFSVKEVSKNSKGQVVSYRSKVTVHLTIKNGEKISRDLNYTEDFAYNNRDNKFDLIEYQKSVKDNIINKILEKIIVNLNV